MEDRQINPDSFYESESEDEKPICCKECRDQIFEYQEYFYNGFPYCTYCKRYFLKIQ